MKEEKFKNVPRDDLAIGMKVLCFRGPAPFEPWREQWKSPAATSIGNITEYNEERNTYSVRINDWGPLYSTIEEFHPNCLHIWGYYSKQDQWGF